MLNSFRNLLSGRTLYVIVGVCALPFIFTGVSSFNTLFSNYGTVNGIEVTQLDVNNATIRVEERYKSKRGMIDGRRLGCQATVQGNIVIDVPPESQVHKQVVRKRAEARDIFINPTTRLFYVEVEQPDMHEPSGDLERLIKSLEKEWNLISLEADFSILKKIFVRLTWAFTKKSNTG